MPRGRFPTDLLHDEHAYLSHLHPLFYFAQVACVVSELTNPKKDLMLKVHTLRLERC